MPTLNLTQRHAQVPLIACVNLAYSLLLMMLSREDAEGTTPLALNKQAKARLMTHCSLPAPSSSGPLVIPAYSMPSHSMCCIAWYPLSFASFSFAPFSFAPRPPLFWRQLLQPAHIHSTVTYSARVPQTERSIHRGCWIRPPYGSHQHFGFGLQNAGLVGVGVALGDWDGQGVPCRTVRSRLPILCYVDAVFLRLVNMLSRHLMLFSVAAPHPS